MPDVVARAAGVLAAVVLTAATGVALSACGGRSSDDSTARPASPDKARAQRVPNVHIMVVVFENHSFAQIIGDRRAPTFNRLARRYMLALHDRAVTHPSLPNYLALAGGRTFGIRSDCTGCVVRGVHVGDQLGSVGATWRLYAESMPGPCFRGAVAGRYAKRHVPFLYFRDVVARPARCRSHVVPLRRLRTDIAKRRVPNVSFVVPNVCHDMHDCSVATADSWLRRFMRRVAPLGAFVRRGAIVVTFDEDAGTPSNHIATIVVNPRAVHGRRLTAPYTHYSLLRAVDEAFGLPPLGNARTARALPLGPLP